MIPSSFKKKFVRTKTNNRIIAAQATGDLVSKTLNKTAWFSLPVELE